jgi:hypothetical protein
MASTTPAMIAEMTSESLEDIRVITGPWRNKLNDFWVSSKNQQ